MNYPKFAEYEVLYGRYLAPKRTEELISLCGNLKGARVLDMCGGGGRASLLALSRGAREVVLLDESQPMTAHLEGVSGLTVLNTYVFDGLDRLDGHFDAVVCQQAVNYWIDESAVSQLARMMRSGAVFVFNSFWDCPSRYPVPKEYVHEGRRYMELSWLSDDGHVEHVQVCEGLAAHTTRFKWVSAEDYRRILGPWFKVEEVRDGKTSVYRCTRQ